MPPTPQRFVAIEAFRPNVVKTLPKSVKVGSSPVYYKALLVRLLVGTLDIECSKTSHLIKQRNNYAVLGIASNAAAFKKSLENAIPCNIDKFDLHIRKTLGNNYSLYRDIYFEFCGYFYARELDNQVEAFVHLYRILERIAYCLPLIWAGTAKDYRQTFDTLKKYFADPKEGELKALKKFIADFVDESERQTNADLNITSAFPDWKNRYYIMLFALVKDSPYLVSATPSDQIVIHYEGLLDLVIKCRNRYFHALTGNSQFFDSEQMVDCHEFFSILNEKFANWLSFLLLKVLENELRQV